MLPLVEDDGGKDPGIADLHGSVGLDGMHPTGLNELDFISRKQSTILGRSQKLRTDPWTVKSKC